MIVHVFTSATSSYLPNARILARSLAEHHPDWKLTLLLNDLSPEGIEWGREEYHDVVEAHTLPIPDFRRWAFDRNVVEFCTGTKGTMTRYLFDERGADVVVYLDPDTVVFSPLDRVLRELEDHDVILTPHLTDGEDTEYGIWSHEMAALKHGTFNLGFYAIANRENGRKYLAWWEDRCLARGQIDFESGLFTDQKWCNLAPYLFDGIHVLCDRTYNVATWNMRNRQVSRSASGTWLVNGEPLRFYHFSGFGNNFHWADRELQAFSQTGTDLARLWDWYKDQCARFRLPGTVSWRWGLYDDGSPILPAHRAAYRANEALRGRFSDPFTAEAQQAIRQAAEPDPAPESREGVPASECRPARAGGRGLVSRLRTAMCEPRRGVEMARKALWVLRREGLAGVRRRSRG